MRVVRVKWSAVAISVWIAAASGCAVPAADPADGELSVNLVGTAPSGTVYRLRDAIITVQGPASTVFNTEDDSSRVSLSANVAVGDYTARIESGWRIERVEGTIATPVTGTLLSANPASFSVRLQQRTNVPLRFHVENEEVDLTQGYDITLDIDDVPPRTLFAINDDATRLQRIDPDTFTVTDVGALGVSYLFGDCAWDSDAGFLYMVNGFNRNGLYRIDLATGAARLVGTHGAPSLSSLAYHPPSRAFYGINFVGDLYRIDGSTAVATKVATSLPRPGASGMAWDSKRSIMLGLTSDGSGLYAIDVATGAASRLATPAISGELGITYDAAIDRVWVADSNGKLLQLDPTNNYASRAAPVSAGTSRSCLAAVPEHAITQQRR